MPAQEQHRLVAQVLPVWPAGEETAAMAAAEEVPELVAGEGAAESAQHHQLNAQVAA
ncbi:hypothetical protein D9M68_773020 [compost metagenome]